MPTQKGFVHDKQILLMMTLNFFLAFVGVALIVSRLSSGQAGDYIVQRRANLGIDQYTQGNIVPILSFIVFVVVVFTFHTVIGARAYNINKQISVVILGLGTVLLLTAIIVSNALLALH